LQVNAGDRIAIGTTTFTIRGVVSREPGGGPGGLSLGPRIYIDYADLASTGLLGFGSRAQRMLFVRVPEDKVSPLMDALRRDLRQDFINARSYQSREDQIGRDFARAEDYLSLVGLVIVILGGVAVSSVTRVFILQKIRSIAVLKCLGARNAQIIAVYILQVMILGLAGSLLGVAIARAAVGAIPLALKTSARRCSPRRTTASAGARRSRHRHRRAGLAAVFSGAAAAGTVHQTVAPAARRVGAAAEGLARHRGARGRLGGAGRGHGVAGLVVAGRPGGVRLVRGARRRAAAGGEGPDRADRAVVALEVVSAPPRGAASVPSGQPDEGDPARGRAGRVLHRRDSITAGEPARRFSIQTSDESPDMFLLDIQRSQADGVRTPATLHGAGAFQLIPVLRARGRFWAQTNVDGPEEVRQRGISLGREFTLVSGSLEANEKVIAGAFWSSLSSEPSVGRTSDRRTRAASRRRHDPVRHSRPHRQPAHHQHSQRQWRESRNGGFVLCSGRARSSGAADLRRAAHGAERRPHGRALTRSRAAIFNVSVIDFRDVLERLRDVMSKVTLAISIVGGLVLFSGVLILIGAVAMTKFQRVYEAAVFKTLGANTRTIARMLLFEYGVLGSLAGLIGSVGAIGLTWGVSTYALEIPWRVFLTEHVAGVGLTAILVAVIGVVSSLDVLRHKPLATLRAE
jgi:putative ABC transport system permease protein